MFGPTYNATKLKLNLKLAITRLGMLQKKNENAGVLSRKEVARLLEKDKVELAKIRTEQVIRDDFYSEALEILEMYCSLVLTRFGLLESVKHCHESLQEAVCSIIWAAPRVSVDVKEFVEIKKQFELRFGREFVAAALQNTSRVVSPRIIHKLGVMAPEETLVNGYLKTIADIYHVDWQPTLSTHLLDTSVPDTFPDVPGGGAGAGGAGGGNMDLLHPEPAHPAIPHDLAFPPPMAQAPPAMHPPAMHAGAIYPPPAAANPAFPTKGDAQFAYPPQNPSAAAAAAPAYTPGPAVHRPAAATAPAEEEYNPFPDVPESPSSVSEPSLTTIPDLPAVPGSDTASEASGVPDFDDLTRRFERLKRDR